LAPLSHRYRLAGGAADPLVKKLISGSRLSDHRRRGGGVPVAGSSHPGLGIALPRVRAVNVGGSRRAAAVAPAGGTGLTRIESSRLLR